MENVRLYKVLTKITPPWPETGLLPEDMLTRVDTTTHREMEKELTKPMKFT